MNKQVSKSGDFDSSEDTIGVYCGKTPPIDDTITSTKNSLWVRLVTNPSGENTGFRIAYKHVGKYGSIKTLISVCFDL